MWLELIWLFLLLLEHWTGFTSDNDALSRFSQQLQGLLLLNGCWRAHSSLGHRTLNTAGHPRCSIRVLSTHEHGTFGHLEHVITADPDLEVFMYLADIISYQTSPMTTHKEAIFVSIINFSRAYDELKCQFINGKPPQLLHLYLGFPTVLIIYNLLIRKKAKLWFIERDAVTYVHSI